MSTLTLARSSTINAKPMDTILSAIDVNPDTRYLLINPKPMDMISACMFQWEPNYSLAAIKSEFLYQLSIFLHVPLSTEYISSCSSGRLSTLEQFYRETEFPWLNLESQIRAKKIPVSLPSSPIKMLCESVQGFLIYDKILKIYISPLKWRK